VQIQVMLTPTEEPLKYLIDRIYEYTSGCFVDGEHEVIAESNYSVTINLEVEQGINEDLALESLLDIEYVSDPVILDGNAVR